MFNKRNLLFTAFILLGCISTEAQLRKVLLFYKTTGYYHESIPAGMAAIQALGKQNGFSVDTTGDAGAFREDNLKQYAAVIFLSTSGNVFDTFQKTAMERYIQAGGGFMGIHSASTTEKSWTWYGRLVGAVFTNHPEAQEGTVIVTDSVDKATRHLPERWLRKDEWYNFRDRVAGVHVLLAVDETSYKGSSNEGYHPLAWYHAFDGGRSFYTALGHFPEAYSDPLFLQHLLAGIAYAMGKKHRLHYRKARTKRLSS